MAKECYSASTKKKTVYNVCLDEYDMRNEANTRPEPSEELDPVPLDDDPEHLAYIDSKLAEDLRSPATQFDELHYSTQAMHPKESVQLRLFSPQGLSARSPATQFDELDYSPQAIQPKSPFTSSYSAHKASVPGAQ